MSCFWASRRQLAIVVALVLVIWLPSTAGQCVFPDGSIAGDYYACPESKVCCLKGEACLSNGLCYAARYNIAYRGACTDKSWPNDDCPRACYNSVPNQWANLLTCSGTARGNFTCSKEVDGKTACEENMETWHWIGDSGVNVTTGQNAISLPSPIDEPPSSTTQVASVSSQTSLEPSSLSGAKSTSIGATTTSIGSSFTPASSNVSIQASATASDSTPPLSKSGFTLEIGLGVGLGVHLMILASVLAFFCIRGRRQINARSSSHGSTIFYPSGHVVRVREAGYGPHELGAQKYIPELYG